MSEVAQGPRPPEGTSPKADAIRLLVERPSDEIIVRALLQVAGYPLDRVIIEQPGGKVALAVRAARLTLEEAARYAALVDLDERSVPDAVTRVRDQLGDPAITVFCAVPSIEAWLFADEQAAAGETDDPEAVSILQRLGLPEEIPDPKNLAHRIFGPPQRWGDVIARVDLQRACARSPSRRAFLVGLGRMLGVGIEVPEESVSRSISRDTLAGLIAEVSPADAILWETSGGEVFTAAELRRHIEAGSDIGRQYASDLLRVSRDFLRRRAGRRASG